MADNDANKDNSPKKSGLLKKFGLVAGGLVLAGGAVVGTAAAVNGVDRRSAETPDHTATLRTTEIKPVFQKQVFDTPDAHYWCFTVANVKCPIPVDAQNQPTYNALKAQLKK
jgi:hypothetical protein